MSSLGQQVPSMTKERLGILISGRGSNMQALVAASQQGLIPPVAVVMSNTPEAAGLVWAEEQGIPTVVCPPGDYPDRAAHDAAMAVRLTQHGVTLVALAGYMRIVAEPLLTAFPNRVLNIHPSLLPKFGGPGMVGRHVHAAVLAAGETNSGCTVHVVTPDVDGGPIIRQETVPVLPSDTIDSLAARVLAAEHTCYATAIAEYVQQLQSGSPASVID